ncbi:hypothetical protein J6590_100463, partial [Homalodisca vitripennis]
MPAEVLSAVVFMRTALASRFSFVQALPVSRKSCQVLLVEKLQIGEVSKGYSSDRRALKTWGAASRPPNSHRAPLGNLQCYFLDVGFSQGNPPQCRSMF